MGFSFTGVCRASRRVVAVEVHTVLLAAAQGGRALVAGAAPHLCLFALWASAGRAEQNGRGGGGGGVE
jgi:hypothetical protein